MKFDQEEITLAKELTEKCHNDDCPCIDENGICHCCLGFFEIEDCSKVTKNHWLNIIGKKWLDLTLGVREN